MDEKLYSKNLPNDIQMYFNNLIRPSNYNSLNNIFFPTYTSLQAFQILSINNFLSSLNRYYYNTSFNPYCMNQQNTPEKPIVNLNSMWGTNELNQLKMSIYLSNLMLNFQDQAVKANQSINFEEIVPNKLFINNNTAIDQMEFHKMDRERLLKNNKLVFTQSSLKKDKKSFQKVKAESKVFNKEYISNKKNRGSKFRGVSKNGNQWQVLIMIRKRKRYLGSFSTEEEAARVYDRVSLQNHGNKAKTNYFYSQDEIKEIINSHIIFIKQDD